MKKVIVYGMGGFYNKNQDIIKSEAEIVAYANSCIDSSTSITGKTFEGKNILAPNEINQYDFDYVYICTEPYNANPIYNSLIHNGIGPDKIEFLWKREAIDGYWIDISTEENDGFISDINGIKIKQKYHTDFDFVPEVFYYNTYYLDLGEDDSVVIDIGMNIGIASLYFASKKEVVKVYGFEPFKDTYDQAISNFKINKDSISSKIIPYNYGLIDRDEEKDIAISAEESGYRDIFAPATDGNKTHIVCKNAGSTINDIIKMHEGKKIILKIDTEGSEYIIFNSLMEYSCFEKIDAVLMEYHDGADVLIKILKDNSFKILIHGPKNKLGMLYAIR